MTLRHKEAKDFAPNHTTGDRTGIGIWAVWLRVDVLNPLYLDCPWKCRERKVPTVFKETCLASGLFQPLPLTVFFAVHLVFDAWLWLRELLPLLPERWVHLPRNGGSGPVSRWRWEEGVAYQPGFVEGCGWKCHCIHLSLKAFQPSGGLLLGRGCPGESAKSIRRKAGK